MLIKVMKYFYLLLFLERFTLSYEKSLQAFLNDRYKAVNNELIKAVTLIMEMFFNVC